jgi:hypothetical protein
MAGTLPTWTSAPARWLRDVSLQMQDRLRWSKRRTMALVVGENPREEEHLRGWERRPGQTVIAPEAPR